MRYQKGLSSYELTKRHVHSRIYDGLGGSRTMRNRKMAAIDAVFGQAMDRDIGGRNHVITPDEFKSTMDSLVKGGLISHEDAAHAHSVSEKFLND